MFTGSVYGLPDTVQDKENIYFLQHNESSLDITLQCRCTIYTPKWIQHDIGSDDFTISTYPVQCVNNGKDCSPVSYISANSAKSGYYLYQNSTFIVNQTSILMCSSTKEKITVVISLKGNNN